MLFRSGIVEKSLHQQLLLTFDYTHLSKVEYELRRTSFYVEPIEYKENIQCIVWVPVNLLEEVKQHIQTWTSGQVQTELGHTAYQVRR